MTTALTPSPAAAASGTTAVERLYAEYGDQLYRFCLKRLRSREEAEDAVQNTFLRAHSALRKGVSPRLESAWLHTIAQNVCLSRYEVAGRRARNEAPHDPGVLELALAAPERHHDELVGLADALASMPPNLRRAILLREWQGLSYAEVAEEMDVSVSAVETLIFRARRHLAAALREDGKSPARRIAGLVDLGMALAALRGALARGRELLAGIGSSQVAVGAALVAVGGAGLGAAVTAAISAPRPAPTRTPAARIVATPVARTTTVAGRSTDLPRRSVFVLRSASAPPAAQTEPGVVPARADAGGDSGPAGPRAQPPGVAEGASPPTEGSTAGPATPSAPVPAPPAVAVPTAPPTPSVEVPTLDATPPEPPSLVPAVAADVPLGSDAAGQPPSEGAVAPGAVDAGTAAGTCLVEASVVGC